MQYVNNDNEDIFRSAAEGYSLSTRGMDWEKMKARMAEPEKASTAERKGRGAFVPVVLLLLAALPWLQLQQDRIKGLHAGHAAIVSVVKTHAEGSGNINQNLLFHDVFYSTVPEGFSSSDDLVHGTLGEKPSINSVDVSAAAQIEAWQPSIMAVDFPEVFHPSFAKTRPSRVLIDNESDHLFADKLPIIPPIPVAKPHKFYVVAEGGLDKTTIDFQSTNKIGKQYGLLLGYDISKKFSVEAGVLMDRKYYYTEGSYLSKDRIYLPPNSKILEASGDCSMFEVPVLLRFRPFNRLSNLSVSAGAVSYIMKRESYDYLYYYGNNGSSAVHSWTYNNSGTNLVAATQVSAAYDMPVTSHLRIRVEPYVNIPMQGMGYSKLKLMSTGLHVGIVQHIP